MYNKVRYSFLIQAASFLVKLMIFIIQSWKRKAKREARKLLGKGLLICTGKSVATTPSTSTVVQQKASQGPKSVPPIHHTPITHHRAAVTVQKMEEHAVILRVVY
jgi:hypothetical protein